MTVEGYIENGICVGCDICPAKCMNLGFCFYDGKSEGGNDDY